MRIELPKLGGQIIADLRLAKPEVLLNVTQMRLGHRPHPFLTMTVQEAIDLHRGLADTLAELRLRGKVGRDDGQ